MIIFSHYFSSDKDKDKRMKIKFYVKSLNVYLY